MGAGVCARTRIPSDQSHVKTSQQREDGVIPPVHTKAVFTLICAIEPPESLCRKTTVEKCNSRDHEVARYRLQEKPVAVCAVKGRITCVSTHVNLRFV